MSCIKQCSSSTITVIDITCTGDIIIPKICSQDSSVITTIGSSAARYGQMKSLNMSNTEITTIKNYAFCQCENLIQVILPNTIKILSNNAFGVTNIMEINLPASLEDISGGPFNQAYQLNVITVDKLNPIFLSENNCIFSHDYSILYRAVSNIKFSFLKQYFDRITTLGPYCFSGTSLETFTATTLIQSIGEFSFHGCPKLVHLNLSLAKFTEVPYKSIMSIPVTKLIFPSTVTTIRAQAIHSLTSLKVLTLPSSITTIEDGSIIGCTNLEYIFYYSSTTILTKAFYFDNINSQTNTNVKIIVTPLYTDTTFGTIPIHSKDAHNAYYYINTKQCTHHNSFQNIHFSIITFIFFF